VCPVLSWVEADQLGPFLEVAQDGRVRRLARTDLLLGHVQDQGPRPQLRVASGAQEPLDQSDWAEAAADSRNQHPAAFAELIRLRLLEEELHVCGEEEDLLPLNRHQVRKRRNPT
jgi:hypothetical protein